MFRSVMVDTAFGGPGSAGMASGTALGVVGVFATYDGTQTPVYRVWRGMGAGSRAVLGDLSCLREPDAPPRGAVLSLDTCTVLLNPHR
jgi:hypothetical protein